MLTISYLPDNWIINVPKQVHQTKLYNNDFLIRAIRIQNTSQQSVKITKITFNLEKKGVILRNICYFGKALKERVKSLKNIKKLPNLKVFLGKEQFWNFDKISYDLKIQPNQEIGIIKEYFQIPVIGFVDNITLIVNFKQNGEDKSEILQIPVKEYKNKNSYIFPLKGTWMTVGTFNDIFQHRQMHSQEFAMDFIKLDENLKFLENLKLKNEKMSYYKSAIYSIADGKVVDCYDGVPENPTTGEIMFQDPDKRKDLIEKHGFIPALAGNYVVIEHKFGEYSFYAHLALETVKVQKNQNIRKGEIIGLLGNSGNSSAPHLHFQLTNNLDPFKGRGLPCYFSNILNFENEKIDLINDNWMLVSTVNNDIYR
ncbi:MAG: M23 family metallopeptidase [Promethearchaeota archaeon]